MNYINNQNNILLDKLLLYYNENNNMYELIKILNGDYNISLRLIDWFVTNYSKKNFIVIHNKKKQIERFNAGKISPKTKKKLEDKYEEFNVHLNYKSQLKSFQKKQFDPFCRRERINFYYDDKKYIVTTVGQLNFFKWAIENNILKYIRDNINIIEKDMNQNIKKNKSSKVKPGFNNPNLKYVCDQNIGKLRQKRRELSSSATKTVKKMNSEIVIDFD